MMKKALFFIICFFILTTTVYAQTREEFAAQLVGIFNLQDSGMGVADTRGLYFYSDWLQISRPLREAVSVARQSGIFAPPRGQFCPGQNINEKDIMIAKRGLDKFVLFSNDYRKELGVSRPSENSMRASVELDNDDVISFGVNVPFLDKNGLSNSSHLEPDTLVSLVFDEDNNVIFVWEQRYGGDVNDLSNYEVVAVRRGSLYLFDNSCLEIIMASPEALSFGRWVPLGIRYDNFPIHVNTRVMNRGREIMRDDINVNWLDRNANYIVGVNRAYGDLHRMLYVEYE